MSEGYESIPNDYDQPIYPETRSEAYEVGVTSITLQDEIDWQVKIEAAVADGATYSITGATLFEAIARLAEAIAADAQQDEAIAWSEGYPK